MPRLTTALLLFAATSAFATPAAGGPAAGGPGPADFESHSMDTQARLVWQETPGATYNIYRSLTIRRSATTMQRRSADTASRY